MIKLQNDKGISKKVKVGISWTALFFGALVPLVRGDWKWFLISLIATPATLGIFQIIFIFKYNGWYLEDLLEKGYEII